MIVKILEASICYCSLPSSTLKFKSIFLLVCARMAKMENA